MAKKFLLYGLTLGCLVAVLAPMAAQAQVCAPLDNGRVADPFYEGTVIFWDPVVEFRTMTLTISGPCEDIVRTFTPKDEIMFDIREIERIVDGEYTWTLKREASIDPKIQKMLQEARFSGEEEDLWWDVFQAGKIPAGPYTDSGSFTVDRGQIIDPNSGEEKRATLAGRGAGGASSAITASVAGGLTSGEPSGEPGGPVLATKDTVLTNSNGVIRNSLCVGFDCLNNNTYSDTTIMLTENNNRIKFDDTSSINSFPRNDWEIEANSNLNGGASYLGFNDCGQSSGGGCATDLVFAVEAGVRQNALYVESDGDVGLGTSNPVVRLHVIDGDTPALRLEQDGSSGFEPQVWDVAGNETSFFVRDATNGSTLPFRIFPASESNSLVIRDGDIGVGTTSPGTFDNGGDKAAIHIRRTSTSESGLLIERASASAASDVLLELRNNGTPRFDMIDTSSGTEWRFEASGAGFNINDLADGGTAEFVVQPDGDVIIEGSLTVGPGGCTGCDLVFSPEYEVESIEDHAAYMWANSHLPGVGPTPEDQPMNLSKKTGGILNELEKAHIYIEELHTTVKGLEARLGDKESGVLVLVEELAAMRAELEALRAEK